MADNKQHHAIYYERLDRQRVGCFLCPHNCNIPSGHTRICGVRYNHDGTLIAESYGRITALALDPIEKTTFGFIPAPISSPREATGAI